MVPHEQTNHGKSKNGLSAEELAKTGHSVFVRCGAASAKQWNESQEPFFVMACTAIRMIDEAIAAEAPMNSKALAITLQQSTGDHTFFANLPDADKIAWEAVGRHFSNLLHSESGTADAKASEDAMILWANRKIAGNHPASTSAAATLDEMVEQVNAAKVERNGKHVSTQSMAVPPKEAVSTSLYDVPEKYGLRNQPTEPVSRFYEAKEIPEPTRQATAGFRHVIRLKITDHMRKAQALTRFLELIPDDADEALADIFSEIMKG
jgi:hypothetical protein